MNKPKTFWKRPEGVTGSIFMVGLIGAGLYFATPILLAIAAGTAALLQTVVTIGIIAALAFMLMNKRTRNLIWYGYKSIMRWVTSLFVQLDPIGILKSYVDDLKDNLRKMNKQITELKKQDHNLKTQIQANERARQNHMNLAQRAKQKGMDSQMILNARKAARMEDSNKKLEVLQQKIEVLYKILVKMYQNSEIMVEDIQDQVKVKEMERKTIRASHSAMKSAMNIIAGNSDKQEMFNMTVEHLAEDVANKVGEMERMMEMSTNFMDSIDLQNGVFEEEGLKMLEQWEKQTSQMFMNDTTAQMLNSGTQELDINVEQTIDINQPIKKPIAKNNQYDTFFD